jgi:N-acetylmuramoyl-L-alanine amidase
MGSVTNATLYSLFLTALCAWREADDQPLAARIGVISVINNRAAVSSWWNGGRPNDPVEVILFPDQFDCFNPDDPNITRWPLNGDPIWEETKLAAIAPGPDNTGGATSYYDTSIPAPSWTTEMTFTVAIGTLRFYKL